jgi:HEAT repeat protein
MSIWTSPYVLVLGALILIWCGVSAYVLVTRALYDFRHFSFHGARRVLQHWLANAETPEAREAILRRLPLRTLAGIASDSRVDAETARTAARIVLERSHGRMLRRATHHRNEAEKWARVAALRMFAVAERAQAWPLLERALNDDDEDVIAAMVALLGERPEEEATALLVTALVAGRYQRSRIATQLETREIADDMLRLVDHADEELRYWAATLLRPFAAEPRVELALASLGGDISPRVRAAALKSLAHAGGTAAAAVAAELLGDDTWIVRAQAARALGASGRADLASLLVPLLRDGQWWVRTAAKESLAELGHEVVPALLTSLRTDDRFARNGAAEIMFTVGALARWADEAASEADDSLLSRVLMDALAAGEAPVQRAAVASLEGDARRKVERLIARLPATRAS